MEHCCTRLTLYKFTTYPTPTSVEVMQASESREAFIVLFVELDNCAPLSTSLTS